MGKAILAKAGHLNGTRPNGKTPAVSSAETLAEVFGSKDAGLIPNKHRAFLMDTQIKYTVVSGQTVEDRQEDGHVAIQLAALWAV